MRAFTQDEWDALVTAYPPGTPVTGEVVSCQVFGVFVRLDQLPEVTALLEIIHFGLLRVTLNTASSFRLTILRLVRHRGPRTGLVPQAEGRATYAASTLGLEQQAAVGRARLTRCCT